MRSRRLACLLLGMWLAGGLVAAWSYFNTRHFADDSAAAHNPNVVLRLKSLPSTDVGMILRFAAWEDARGRLETAGWTELVTGVAFFFFLLFGTAEGMTSLVLGLLLLSIAVAQAFLLNPGITSLGRLIDFVPPGANAGDRAKLSVLEGCLMGLEGLKLGIGIALAWLLIRHSRERASGGAWDQLNMIDKSDHSHINR